MPALTVPIALAITGAATAGTAAYAAHRAGSTNDKSLAAQERSDERASQLDRDRLDAEKQARADTLALDERRWTDYVKANQPTWQASGGVLNNLFGLAGMSGGGSGAPASGAPMAGPPSSSMPPSNGGGVSLSDLAMGQPMQARRRTIVPPTPQSTGGGMDIGKLLSLAQLASSGAGSPGPSGTPLALMGEGMRG